jgi:hypothetical protein
MQCTNQTARPQPFRPPDYPATPAEAAPILERWPHLGIHRGRPVETIGQTLTRLVDKTPDPLPEEFLRRFAASVAQEPSLFGRVFRHGLRAIQEPQSHE